MADEHFSYGGQAVIEGVMIRGRRGYATAFRLADGGIEVSKHPWEPLTRRHRLLSLPIIRGTPALIDAMMIGYRSLMASADVAARGEGIKPPSPFHYALSIVTALAIAIGGFVLGPSAVIQRLHAGWLVNNLVEGGIRALAFVGFILLVSLMSDMRRVFQYHGAEHKVINSFEATGRYGKEEAERYRTLHQRCGTSFIFTVLVVGIFVHALVGWPTSIAVRLGTRLLLLPIVAGLAYEIIRLAGAHKSSRLLGVMVAPGMWLQRITTREPSEDQVEVAIKALEGALELDGAEAAA
ncbi:MAG: DUF1385 domain-containing protein [Armatimonadota bacterium]